MDTVLHTALAFELVPASFVAGKASGPRWQALQRAEFLAPLFVQGDWSGVLGPAARDIVVYATRTCPWCTRTRELLIASGALFREFLIDESGDAQRAFSALDGEAVPLIFVGERRIIGFDEPAIREALQWLASASRPSRSTASI